MWWVIIYVEAPEARPVSPALLPCGYESRRATTLSRHIPSLVLFTVIRVTRIVTHLVWNIIPFSHLANTFTPPHLVNLSLVLHPSAARIHSANLLSSRPLILSIILVNSSCSFLSLFARIGHMGVWPQSPTTPGGHKSSGS